MPPSGSLSPRRKRVRKNLSLSSASGAKWVSGLAPLGAPPVAQRRRRGSSPAVTSIFPLSAHDHNHTICSDDEEEYRRPPLRDEPRIPHAETYPAISPPQRQPLTYASLPPTPISSSPPRCASPPPLPQPVALAPPKKLEEPTYEPFSIWDYLREELLATDFDSHQELKWERVSNFLSMPVAMEKVRDTTYICILGHVST